MRNLNIKFNNCSYLQLLIDDIDIRLFDEFDDFLIVYSELYASAQNSGKFLIFTCACGVADDGGWDYVNVTHKKSSIESRFLQKNTLGQALIKVSNIMTTNPVRNNKELRIDISSKKSIYDINSGFMLKTDGLERDLETLFKNGR